MKPSDRNVANVIHKMAERAAVGLEKYGVDTEHAGLPLHKWLQHMQEELMDGAVYAEAAIQQTADYERLRAVARELLRLYDWRQELGAAVKAGRATQETQRGDLLKYGMEKRAAWQALRAILFPKVESDVGRENT